MKGVAVNLNLSRAGLLLEAHQTIGVVGAVGARVDVRRGKIWITQEAETRDFIVAAGDGLTLERPGLALVHALQPAEVTLGEPGDCRPARSGARPLAALKRWLASIFGPEAIERCHPGPGRRYL